MQPSLRSLALVLLGTFLALLALYFSLPHILPFLIALAIAGLIDRPVNKIEQRLNCSRGVAVIVVLASFLAVSTGLLILVVGNVVHEVELFARRLPHYAQLWQESLDHLRHATREFFAHLPHPLDETLENTLHALIVFLGQATSTTLNQLQYVPNLLFASLVTAITTFFLSRDKRQIARFLMQFVPDVWQPALFEMKRHIVDGLFGFVKAQAILIGITMVLTTITFLAFQVRYAWLLGLSAGVLDLLPTVGPSLIFGPLVASMLFEGAYVRGVGLGAVWIALLLLRQLLEPKILGSQVGIHPVGMILALYFAISLIGLNGLWIGPCVAITLKAVYHVVVRPETAR